MTVPVGRVSECVLILFRTICGSAWSRCCHLHPNGAVATPGACALPIEWHSPA